VKQTKMRIICKYHYYRWIIV